jgi:hypothetical protein
MAGRARGRVHRLVALGAAGIAAVSLAFVVVVSPLDAAVATTTTLSGPAGAVFGEPVTVTASVECAAASATGTVSFLSDGVVVAQSSLDSSGAASASLPELVVGSHSLTASYDGDSNCEPSTSSPAAISVEKATTTVTLDRAGVYMVGAGYPFVVRATVAAVPPSTATPTGTVSFLIDGVSRATGSLDAGGASATLTIEAEGEYTLSVQYSGDGQFEPSSVETPVVAGVVPPPEPPPVEPPGPPPVQPSPGGATSVLPLTTGLPATGRTKSVSFRESGSELPDTGSSTTTLLIVALAILMTGSLCIAAGTRPGAPASALHRVS